MKPKIDLSKYEAREVMVNIPDRPKIFDASMNEDKSRAYRLIREFKWVARKKKDCVWCSEPILRGEEHVHTTGKYMGSTLNDSWHLECRKAALAYFAGGDEEFEWHGFVRGTSEVRDEE